MRSAGQPLVDTEASRSLALFEWRRGWKLVLVSLLGYSIATIPSYSLGVFMEPIQREFGWSRGEISAGLLVYSVIAVIFSPFVGLLIDRRGARHVGLAGMTLYCAAFALLASVSGSIWLWWSIWLLVALGGVFIKPTLWATAISKQFSVQRGVALALLLCGSGISSAIFPSIGHGLIDSFGWRSAYFLLAAGAAVLMLPLMALYFREDTMPEPSKREAGTLRGPISGLSVREAMLSYRFVAIAAPTLLMTSATIGTVVHFVPIMASSGVSATAAAAMTGLIGLGTVIGRIATGFLLDRFPGTVVGAISFAIPIVPLLLLIAHLDGTAIHLAIAALIGLSVGSEVDIVAYVTSRYFGLRNYGTIFGTLIGIMALGAGVGPTIAGLTFDLSGSYQLFFWAQLPCAALSSLLIASLGKYPDPPGASRGLAPLDSSSDTGSLVGPLSRATSP